MYHLANLVHYHICTGCRAFFSFSVFSWPKVLAQSPTSLCYILLVDVLRTHKAGMSLCYMLLVDVLRTHKAGMPSHFTCKKKIVSRLIFSALFFHPVIVWFLPSIFPFRHKLSLLSIVQIFLVLFYFYSIYFPFLFICLLIFLLFLSRYFLYFITHFILLRFPYIHKFIIDFLEKSKAG